MKRINLEKIAACFFIANIVIACNNTDGDTLEELQQGKVLSFTEMQTKYIDNLLTYEFSKTGKISLRSATETELDLNSMSSDEKRELVMQLSEIKNAPTLRSETGEIESPEDEAFYFAQYEALLAELNAHPLVIAELQKEGVESEPSNMMYYLEGQTYSKFDVLQQAENPTQLEDPNTIQLRSVRTTLLSRWPKVSNTIDYRFGKDASTNTKTNIRAAMNQWQAAANNRIKYKEINNSAWNQLVWSIGCSWHIWIHDSKCLDAGGMSTAGYVPWSTITINPNSASSNTYLHELGHSLGLIHEHQRPDRDNYIIVDYNNIKSNSIQFNKILSTSCQTYGTFDFESIMMYRSYIGNWAKDPNKPIMKKKSDNSTFGDNYVLSAGDKANIKLIYN